MNLPTNWAQVPLSEVTKIVAGYGFPKRLQGRQGGDYPFYKVGDISRAWVEGRDSLTHAQHYLDANEASSIRAKPFPPGTVVFAKIGAAIALNRRAKLSQQSLVDNNVMGLIPNDGAVEEDFLFNFSKTLRLDELSQATTVPSLRKGDVEKIEFPLPPLNEQRRIVAKIEDLTARSRNAQHALDAIPPLLERFRQSVLAAAFRGDLTKQWRQQNPNSEPASELLKRIRQERRHRWEQDYLQTQKAKGKQPKNDKWKEKYQEPEPVDAAGLPDLPERWCWVCAQDLCVTSITKGTTPKSTAMSSDNGDVPYIKVYNLTMRGELDFSVNPTFVDLVTHKTKLARSRVFPGDVLMNIVGPPLGKVSLVPDSFPEWNTNQAVAIFRLASAVSRWWFAYRLLSQEALFWLRGQSRATSGQFNVSLADCRNLPVPLAPLEEQRRIESLVYETFSLISSIEVAQERSHDQLEFLDQSILAKAFRGELVPQDPSDEPALALLERISAKGKNG